MNAIAHAVEALYAKDGNPVISLMAEEGIAALGRALPRITSDRGDRGARSDALYGAWLCGMVLAATTMGLHHKLAHVLGGAFDLPHSETHTALLPHAAAYNAGAASAAVARVARALGVFDAPSGLYDLAGRLGAKRALRDLGMPEAGIDTAVERTMADPYWNPRPLDVASLRELLVHAWKGEPPG
jgi:maleylacetate reductase